MSETRSKSAAKAVLPLAGMSVVRLGRSRAGRFLCRLLADQGAEVRDSGPASPVAQASTARIVINDLGRGNAPAAGLDFDSLAKANPHLVYCALVGFPAGGPADGPDLADGPILAELGLRLHGDEAPRQEPLPVASFFGAVMAGIYIGCALLPKMARRPQYIEVPLFSAALNVVSRELVTVDDPKYFDPSRDNPRLPISQLYRCADGEYLQPHGMYGRFVRIICEVGGHPEWVPEAVAGIACLPNRAAIGLWRERLAEMFRQRPAAEWEDLINAAGGAATVVRRHADWKAEAHAAESGLLTRDAASGRWRVGAGVVVTAKPGAKPRRSQAPRPAAAMAPSPGTPKPLPLAGVRIVDFCIVIAGPTCGRVLAELGADIVKIDAADRDLGSYLWLDVNRGKRSLVLDLKTDGGREIAAKLVAGADVVLQNFRTGKIDAFGFDYAALAKARPDLVYGSFNCYDHAGPWAGRAGWEHNAQAAAGMQWGRAVDGVPKLVPFPINDYGTGLLGAFGIVMGLVLRGLAGIGSHVTGSLTRSATFIQMEALEGDGVAEPAGRTFRCSDGWVSAWPAGAVDLSGLATGAAGRTCGEVLGELRGRGIRAAVERRPRDLLKEPWMTAAGLLVRWDHPEFGPLSQPTPQATASDFAADRRHPAPSPGSDGPAILTELGYGSRLEALSASKAVYRHLPLFKEAG